MNSLVRRSPALAASTPNPVAARNGILLVPLLMALLFCAPLLLALVVYRMPEWQPGHSLVSGELVTPVRTLDPPPLRKRNGVPVSDGLFRGHWTLLYLQRGRCDAPCRGLMDTLRRVRLGQGEGMRRVQRVLAEPVAAQLADAPAFALGDPGLRLVGFRQWGLPDDVVYLVDPRGNLALRYPRGFAPEGLLHDLQRLLRGTGAG